MVMARFDESNDNKEKLALLWRLINAVASISQNIPFLDMVSAKSLMLRAVVEKLEEMAEELKMRRS